MGKRKERGAILVQTETTLEAGRPRADHDSDAPAPGSTRRIFTVLASRRTSSPSRFLQSTPPQAAARVSRDDQLDCVTCAYAGNW
ncbi:hypothetical protein MRX96_049007 [Rhipicephalus microplus]